MLVKGYETHTIRSELGLYNLLDMLLLIFYLLSHNLVLCYGPSSIQNRYYDNEDLKSTNCF